MVAFTSDQWIIVALVFVLGLLVGGFLFSGGGRKWKHRYRSEVDRREQIEREHRDARAEWDNREKTYRDQAARPVVVQQAPATERVIERAPATERVVERGPTTERVVDDRRDPAGDPPLYPSIF